MNGYLPEALAGGHHALPPGAVVILLAIGALAVSAVRAVTRPARRQQHRADTAHARMLRERREDLARLLDAQACYRQQVRPGEERPVYEQYLGRDIRIAEAAIRGLRSMIRDRR